MHDGLLTVGSGRPEPPPAPRRPPHHVLLIVATVAIVAAAVLASVLVSNAVRGPARPAAGRLLVGFPVSLPADVFARRQGRSRPGGSDRDARLPAGHLGRDGDGLDPVGPGDHQ